MLVEQPARKKRCPAYDENQTTQDENKSFIAHELLLVFIDPKGLLKSWISEFISSLQSSIRIKGINFSVNHSDSDQGRRAPDQNKAAKVKNHLFVGHDYACLL